MPHDHHTATPASSDLPATGTDPMSALRESEEKFAKAFRVSPNALTITELATGRFIDVNHGFERLTGYLRHEVIGRTTLELGLWRDPGERVMFREAIEQTGTVRDAETLFRTRRGDTLVTKLSCERLELGGKVCALSVIEDITAQRAAEQRHRVLEAQLRETQKLQALGTLAGGIAHDFNNILTAIIVNQEIAVLEIQDASRVRHCLNEINRASLRAKELVAQILAFSRRQELRRRVPQNLRPVVCEAMALVRASLPATIEIEQTLAIDTPAVLADPTQIHQVLMNLCANAEHALRGRAGRLTVTLGPRTLSVEEALAIPDATAGRHVQLTVADNGHGMSPAVAARMFEPFYTTKPPGEGTGLGLSVVHGIMRDHGGAIAVHSALERGTRIDLLFPATTQTQAEPDAAGRSLVPGGGARLLVIDDEEAIGVALRRMLEKLNYRVVVFTDPVEALRVVQERSGAFDLVLSDVTMPRMTGLELVAGVKRIRPDIKIILMSGAGTQLSELDPNASAFTFVAKPIDAVELTAAIGLALAPD